jgi:proline iminopeptidase
VLTAANDVRDLEALRLHFGIQNMTLIGLSWGSGLAALYADAHPEHVS